MQLYKVRISLAARADMVELRKFLKAMMTEEGAVRYAWETERGPLPQPSSFSHLYRHHASHVPVPCHHLKHPVS